MLTGGSAGTPGHAVGIDDRSPIAGTGQREQPLDPPISAGISAATVRP